MFKEDVRLILENASSYHWTLQGFGMLRLYMKGYRLHVWSDNHKVNSVSEMHTHPWNFTSKIIAGTLQNHIYKTGIPSGPGEWMYQQKIKCGEGGGLTGERERKYVFLETVDIYYEGDSYNQRFDEIHVSNPADGAVTLVERKVPENVSPDHAYVYYPVGTEWVSAEPRKATNAEVKEITENALNKWFYI